MRKLLAGLLALSLLVTGLWWMARRRPGAPPPEGTPIA